MNPGHRLNITSTYTVHVKNEKNSLRLQRAYHFSTI